MRFKLAIHRFLNQLDKALDSIGSEDENSQSTSLDSLLPEWISELERIAVEFSDVQISGIPRTPPLQVMPKG